MKSHIAVLSLFILSVLPCFAESRSKQIETRMRECFDFDALTEFVRKTVADHPAVDGVPISKTRVRTKWKIEMVDPPSRMRSGDWVVWFLEEKDPEFEVYYEYGAGKVVTIVAEKIGRDHFALKKIELSEMISLR